MVVIFIPGKPIIGKISDKNTSLSSELTIVKYSQQPNKKWENAGLHSLKFDLLIRNLGRLYERMVIEKNTIKSTNKLSDLESNNILSYLKAVLFDSQKVSLNLKMKGKNYDKSITFDYESATKRVSVNDEKYIISHTEEKSGDKIQYEFSFN